MADTTANRQPIAHSTAQHKPFKISVDFLGKLRIDGIESLFDFVQTILEPFFHAFSDAFGQSRWLYRLRTPNRQSRKQQPPVDIIGS